MHEIVKTATKDGLYLHGLINKGEKHKYAVIYIHGYESDFFTNTFIKITSTALKENEHTFLAIQTRGMGCSYLFKKIDGTYKKIGAHYELLKEAYLDIDAWIDYLVENGYKNIILLGHSLGSIKATRYFAEGHSIKYIQKLILLAPFDVHANAEKMSGDNFLEFLEVAKQKVMENDGDEIVPQKYSQLDFSYKTALSWVTFDHFGKMFNFADKQNNFMLLNKIEIPVKVIVGRNDPYFHPSNPNNFQEAIDILKLNIKQFESKIIENSGHSFDGKEHEVAQSILEFLEK